MRFGAFNAAGERVSKLEIDIDACTMKGSGGIELQNALSSALAGFQVPDDGDPEHLTNAFSAAVAPLGLTIRRIPDADVVFNAHVDFKTGMAVGRTDTHEGADTLGVELQMRIIEGISSVAASLSDDLAKLIEASTDDPSMAADALTEAHLSGSLNLPPSPRLGDALEAVDVGALDDERARAFLRLRVMIATRLDRYEDATRDAKTCLDRWSDHPAGFASEFRNVQAIAHAKAGRIETAISLWSELAYRTPGIEAGQRAQVLRNLARSVPRHDPRALAWIEQSTDGYLQAGERQEAAFNYVDWGDMLEHHDAAKAVAMIEGAQALIDTPDLHGDALRGALHHVRANRLVALERPAEALAAALEAVAIRRGLAGQEAELLASLALAETVAKDLGDARATDLASEGGALLAKAPVPRFVIGDKVSQLLDAWDEDLAAEVRAWLALSDDAPVRVAGEATLLACDPSLGFEERLAGFEALHDRVEREQAPREVLTPLRVAIAQTLSDAGSSSRAIPWLDAILLESPLAPGVARMLLSILRENGEFSTAAVVARREITLKGQSFRRLMMLSRCALSAGLADEGLRAALGANRLAVDADERSRAQLLIDEGLGEGAMLANALAKPALTSVTAGAFEEALFDFARAVAADYRMDYWVKASPTAEYEWVPKPERRAQLQLRTWLDGRFGGRVTTLEEISTGAGRLDLLVQLVGGPQIILELKMLGFGYSSTYAADGAEQLEHYMQNRNVRLGYLVAFDSRIRDYGKQLVEPPPGSDLTVREVLIDIRPRVVKTRGKGGVDPA